MPTFVLPPSFFINLAGGLGLFLLGMTLLTDGLKLAAGRTLERLLTTWTSTRWRGLLTGFMLTALVQSSSALTVAVIGFVIGFVSDISRRPMHHDVARQLPELLRIATHFDTLARVMYHLGLQSTHPEHPPASGPDAQGQDAIACVVPAFADALAFFRVAAPDDTAPTPHHQRHLASEARERFEATYQNAKAQLLQLGAGGHSQIHTVYDWLARLSDLRRAVEQADKAVQRLAALPDLATTPDEPAPSA